MDEKTSNVKIEPITWQKYLGVRDHVHSADARRFDDPERAVPGIEDDRRWWKESVESGRHLVLSVRLADDSICGLLHAFDFDPEHERCEIGITIFPAENRGRGIGRRATLLHLVYLKDQLGIRRVLAQTRVDNVPAIAMYEKIGFRRIRQVRDCDLDWLVLEFDPDRAVE